MGTTQSTEAENGEGVNSKIENLSEAKFQQQDVEPTTSDMGTSQSTETENEDEINSEIKNLREVKFHLQDVEHTITTSEVDPNTSLNFYLRNTLHMTGTKKMCDEGGCGSCVVVLANHDPITQKDVFLAVNSCLVPLLSCNGWKIYTIEGVGDSLKGYHPLQKVLAKFNGTQCGFCSPGMVMNMYALYESGQDTMEQIENSFSGNICRCTGYRPILSAFKSLSKDVDSAIVGECPDIEDLRACRKKCNESWTKIYNEPSRSNFSFKLGKSEWIKVYNINDLLNTLRVNSSLSYRLVAGNTAQGVYKSYKTEVNLYIDVSDVAELRVHKIESNRCTLGGNVTLNEAIEFLNEVAKTMPQFAYLKLVANHITLVANVPVRNRGTLAGNLIIKHDHPEFPSDIFLILETVGATVTIVDTVRRETLLTPLQFVNCDMNRRVVKTITFRAFNNQTKFRSFKIMPRAVNTSALVNAGFLFNFDQQNLLKSATIVYGNIRADFVHAKKTENLLVGKNLFDNSVLQQAYRSLDGEINPEDRPPETSPQFRKQLAIALFYKFVLSIAPDNKISPKNKTGGAILERPISKGVQDYETNQSLYPLTEPVPKLEALAQTSGQAEFVEDIPDLPYQLFCAICTAKCPPNSTIANIDASIALKHPDIVAFFTKDDIPGTNSFSQVIPPVATAEEEIFCTGKVLYYDQPVGVLVGKSQKAVDEAIALVEITYNHPNTEPLLSIRQVLKAGRTDKINEYKVIQPSRKGNDIKHVIKGTFDIYHQYHFYMETQCCKVVPNENGLDVYASTQWMDLNQACIARMLNISQSQVALHVRRCGGAFGGKLTRSVLVSCIAALASWKLKKPVNIWLPLTTNMTVIGKRFPTSANYEVGVNDQGVIQYLDCRLYSDVGVILNGDFTSFLEGVLTKTYISDTFKISLNSVFTDTHTNTWMRAPGSAEGIALLESIMEHISYSINVDPINVRLANLSPQSPLNGFITNVKEWAQYDQRKAEIQTFNKQNRWKKKGLALVPMQFDIAPLGPHQSLVSIFHGDGSVQISHGGVEIGQGIHTKAAQVCAYKFKIPLEKVTVLPSNSLVAPNNLATGGSVGSDGICYATAAACDELLERLKPYQSSGSKWEDVIKKSFEDNVKLVAVGKYSPNEPGVNPYSVYGVCAVEVEVDILTGQYIVTRVHINEDTGQSLNPIIDVGQVEGAFVMGMGYYLTEQIKFNWEGKIITDNTWTYYPPTALDIPVEILVKFPKNYPNPVGVLKSKGTGEPAFCLAIGVLLAIKNAVSSARTDASGSNSKWYKIDGPSTVSDVFLNSLNNWEQYVL